MKILAFDQSSRTSGWSVFEDGKLIEYGKFTFSDEDFGKRLEKIRNKVSDMIDKYQPDEVVFEDIQLQAQGNTYNYGNNIATFKKLAEVFGVIYELVTERGLSNRAVLSTVWKGKLGLLHGYGQKREAQKQEAQSWVKENYNIKATQDEADAICIGIWASSTQPEKGHDWSE